MKAVRIALIDCLLAWIPLTALGQARLSAVMALCAGGTLGLASHASADASASKEFPIGAI